MTATSTALLGDFNVHHPMWCSVRNPSTHALANTLISTTTALNFTLLTPNGLPTYTGGRGLSTIDLAFCSANLYSAFVSCFIYKPLCFNSDHEPILLSFLLDNSPLLKENLCTRVWKKQDKELISRLALDLPPVPLYSTSDLLDTYLISLHENLEFIATQAVPLSSLKPSSCKAQWWTAEVEQALLEEREARKRWISTRNDFDREALTEATRQKKRRIKHTKRAQWRGFVHEASCTQDLWSLAKWGRGASKELPIMPPLQRGDGTLGISAKEKTDILYDRFFTPSIADLSDITEPFPPSFNPSLDTSLSTDSTASTSAFASSSEPLLLSSSVSSLTSTVQPTCNSPLLPTTPALYPVLPFDYSISYEEVLQALKERKSYSCPGIDSFPYAFLKALGPPLINILVSVISTLWRLGYFSSRYKQARTIVIRKPGKEDYSVAKAWRPIALLSTVGKLIETVTAKKIKEVVEQFSLLPKEQMGFRKDRSTESALDL